MHRAGMYMHSAGNIFEGEWREGKPQLKDNKNKGLADLLPWLNEQVMRRPPPRPAPPRPTPRPHAPTPPRAPSL